MRKKRVSDRLCIPHSNNALINTVVSSLGEASDSTESSSYSCDVPSSVDNPKGVQSRRSMLCPIEKDKGSAPLAKRPKLIKEVNISSFIMLITYVL